MDYLVIPASNYKRRDKRKNTSWLLVGKWKDGESFDGNTINVSASGLMMCISSPPKIGQRAYIKIKTVINGKAIWIDGIIEIKHHSLAGHTYNVGATFIKIKDENKTIIRKFVASKNTTKCPVYVS